MKSQKYKYQTLFILAIGLLVLLIMGAAVFLFGQGKWRHATKASPSPSVRLGNSTHDEPSTSPTTSARPSTSVTPRPTGLTGGGTVVKPTLQKSSGNAPGSSVSAGAMVEFTCEGTEGLSCEVVLTDRNNSSRVVNLGKKTITNNGRGQSFAIWDWSAVVGSWSVVAKASDGTGSSAVSDAQTLEVK